MTLMLRQLHLGKIDGKHEYLTPADAGDRSPFDAFLVPDGVDPGRMKNDDIFYVDGFRGTGKTSLLRWHAETNRLNGAITDFVLFKTDLTESQRLTISKEVGISWTDLDPAMMEFSQDFKDAWLWFIVHKIGENFKSNPQVYAPASKGYVDRLVRLLGLSDESVFTKAFGYMPRLEAAKVTIRSDSSFFKAELTGDFKPKGSQGEVTLAALSKKILSLVLEVDLVQPLYLYFDELEVFYHTQEQHRRDQRMVRDLLFAVAVVNDKFRQTKRNLHVIAAVRSEIIDAMGSLGEEIDRLVHDRGFLISWHHANKSQHHPLLEIVRKNYDYQKLETIQSCRTTRFQTIFPTTSIMTRYLHSYLIDLFINPVISFGG